MLTSQHTAFFIGRFLIHDERWSKCNAVNYYIFINMAETRVALSPFLSLFKLFCCLVILSWFIKCLCRWLVLILVCLLKSPTLNILNRFLYAHSLRMNSVYQTVVKVILAWLSHKRNYYRIASRINRKLFKQRGRSLPPLPNLTHNAFAVGWGISLQAGKSQVRFPMVPLKFFII
jgi:hypothetical protein